MFNIAAFLDRARAGAGDVSDYRLAQLLGLTKQAISNYRNGSIPNDAVALRLCELSGDDPEHVLACLQSMRAANDEEAEVWKRIADRLRRRSLSLAWTALALAASLGGARMTEAQAAPLPGDPAGASAYYVKRRRAGFLHGRRHRLQPFRAASA